MKSLCDYIVESSSDDTMKKVEKEIKSCGCSDNAFIGFALGVVAKDKALHRKNDVITVYVAKDGFETADDSGETYRMDKFEEAIDPDNAQTAGIVMYSKSAKHHLIIINTRAKEIRFDEMKPGVKLNDSVYDTKTLFSLLKENNIINDGEKFTVVM